MIDFSIYPGVGRGLFMDLAPGGAEPVKSEAVHLSEEAFILVEFGIVKHVPAYRNFGHYGETRIPASVWVDVLGALDELHRSIEVAGDPPDLSFEGMSATDLISEFRSNFEPTKAGAAAMLGGISRLTRGWMFTYDGIFVLGI